MSEAAACTPNISFSGRRRRKRVGQVGLAIAAALWLGFILTHAAWYWRLTLFLPIAGATISLLQVRRNTCIARAAEGVIEHEDFSTSPAPKDQLAASRRVAATIYRDAVLVGVAGAAVAALTAFVG